MKTRGLHQVDLVLSDGHKGIQAAVERSFHGASWQMCTVNIIRAVMKKIPRKDQKRITELFKESLNDPRRIQECIIELEALGFSRAADNVERFQFDLMNYRHFPFDH